MPTSSIHLTPRRRKNHGITSMKNSSDIWPSVILPAALVTWISLRNRFGERVVELQRDADQERAEDEDRERSLAHQLERVEAEDVAPRSRACRSPSRAAACAAARGRTGRAAIEPPPAICSGIAVASSPSVPMHSPATIQPIVPSTRIGGNSRAGIGHLPERQRVAQRQRRHVAQRVDQQHAVERRRTWSASTRRTARRRRATCSAARIFSVAKNRSATMPTKNGEIIAASAVVPARQADLLAGELQRLPEPRPHRHVPRAPDEVLQEHHRRQLHAHAGGHVISSGSGFRVPGSGFVLGSGFWVRILNS